MSDFRILQLTDLHVFRDPGVCLHTVDTRESFRRVVDHLKNSGQEFDHIVITGDHTHDERPESYEAVRSVLAPWLDRLLLVPGNHDDRAVLRSVFGDVTDRQAATDVPQDDRIVFSTACGSWLLLGLDTHCPGEVSGHLGGPQADWLRQRLTDHGRSPSILFCHHPPVSVGSEWMDAIGLQDRSLLRDIVADFPDIRVICCGHVHHEFSTDLGTAQVITTPSTGLQFDPAGSSPAFTDAPPGWRIIELSGTGMTTHVERLPDCAASS